MRASVILLPLLEILATETMAQDENPRIGYAYPTGGQRGTTFHVEIGGQNLDGASAARISGTGVMAEVIGYLRPLNQGAFKAVQRQMQELMEEKEAAAPTGWRRRRGDGAAFTNSMWTAGDEKRLAEARAKMTTFYIRPTSVPALVETVSLRVTVAADAPVGRRDLRLQTGRGLTNPLVFEVGQLPEFSEPSARSLAVAESQNGARRRRPPEGTEKPMPGTMRTTNAMGSQKSITLPALLNGQILPGDRDRYGFRAVGGQHLVVEVSARRLIPYLSDAVPGWFQAVATLFDAAGREVAYDDDFRFDPDPVLHCEIPADGDYTLEIRDALYRGREDFVYRIAVGELPYLTSIFPLGGPRGKATAIQITGWNLPVAGLEQSEQAPGVHPVTVRKGALLSNPVPFSVDIFPEEFEREPNDEPEVAQRVSLPSIINGRIGHPGDVDMLCFGGRMGQRIVAEVMARRLDSSLDSMIRLTAPNGKAIAFSDDYEDKAAGLTTHHADSRFSATLPGDGLYYLRVADAQHKGGADYGYRLHLGPPAPDFDLRVVPSGINARAGTAVPVTVHALRRDGFSGDITLALVDPPEGFELAGARVPSGQDVVQMTLTVPMFARAVPYVLSLVGRATIQGRDVARPALPADDLMQAFAYHHLVPAETLQVCVTGAPPPFALRAKAYRTLRIPSGGSARLQVDIPDETPLGAVALELNQPPEGITIDCASLGDRGGEIVFRSHAKTAKPGLKGNLIINAFAVRDAAAMKGKEQRKRPRILLTALPAIPFEVVPGG